MKNTLKKGLSLLCALVMVLSLSTVAFAQDETIEDFTSTSISATGTIEYSIAHENVYTETNAVKISWTVPVLKYDTAITYTWNTATLKWDKASDYTTSDNEVSFKVINYGTQEITATMSFALDSALTAGDATVAFGDTNGATITSIVNTDDENTLKTEENKETYITTNCTNTITGTVTVADGKLAGGAGTAAASKTATLGVYTLTIATAS